VLRLPGAQSLSIDNLAWLLPQRDYDERRAGALPMPKVLDNGTYRVYVYANDDNPHHLPHCHVYWDGNDHASVVSLPDLVVIAGEALPRAARRFLRANVDLLLAAWQRLNP
jgi:hypothetical protein